MEARDLLQARDVLAPGIVMTFPGGVELSSLDELIAWSGPRYSQIAKRYQGFDTIPTAAGAVIYCFGTLHGQWVDSTAFDGIRFIDRFEVSRGKITRQDVWNDMGEARRP